MLESRITEEIIVLMRGFFSTPVISSLGRLGALDIMMSRPSFTIDSFPNIPNKKLLQTSFRYLTRLGLVERMEAQDEAYRASEMGRQIFQRHSSFYVPHSYHEYMNNYFERLLNTSTEARRDVDRSENVVGSGKTHQRYFIPATSFLRRRVNFDLMVDIGCGDGHFLEAVLRDIPDKKAVGVDISQIAIDITYKNLQKRYPDRVVSMVCSDALDVDDWSRQVLDAAGNKRIAISMWFLLHEISRNSPAAVIEYLGHIHRIFPNSPVVIGEIVRHSDNMLVKNKTSSIMPEYLFFHDLSGQGILSWKEYQEVLKGIPYQLSVEKLFDEIPDDGKDSIPSAFVWCLLPK